jgi:hypothetical protein
MKCAKSLFVISLFALSTSSVFASELFNFQADCAVGTFAVSVQMTTEIIPQSNARIVSGVMAYRPLSSSTVVTTPMVSLDRASPLGAFLDLKPGKITKIMVPAYTTKLIPQYSGKAWISVNGEYIVGTCKQKLSAGYIGDGNALYTQYLAKIRPLWREIASRAMKVINSGTPVNVAANVQCSSIGSVSVRQKIEYDFPNVSNQTVSIRLTVGDPLKKELMKVRHLTFYEKYKTTTLYRTIDLAKEPDFLLQSADLYTVGRLKLGDLLIDIVNNNRKTFSLESETWAHDSQWMGDSIVTTATYSCRVL